MISRAVDGCFGRVLPYLLSNFDGVSPLQSHGCHVARLGRNTAGSSADLSAGHSAALLFEEHVLQTARESAARSGTKPPRARENWPQQSLEQAAAKTASYEDQLRAAKAQMYQAQEQLHKQLQEREAAAVAEARKNADAAIKLAKTQLAADVEAAKASLAADSESLANQIAESDPAAERGMRRLAIVTAGTRPGLRGQCRLRPGTRRRREEGRQPKKKRASPRKARTRTQVGQLPDAGRAVGIH